VVLESNSFAVFDPPRVSDQGVTADRVAPFDGSEALSGELIQGRAHRLRL
jgi:hypothetical protein